MSGHVNWDTHVLFFVSHRGIDFVARIFDRTADERSEFLNGHSNAWGT